ncbi:TPA: hypothetical protein [Aquificae Joseph's Coat Spring virus]|nr:TPA: hypothetical protein [Aquificae Joseph's Coat Spring virus]
MSIQELKAKLLAENTGKRRNLPFQVLKVDGKAKKFVLGEQELTEVEVFFISEYAQYIYYDPQLQRLTLLSQITKPFAINNALDLKTGHKIGALVKKMKDSDIKPKYISIFLTFVKHNGKWEEAVFYMKGAVLKSFMEIKQDLKNEGKEVISSVLHLGLKPKKKGSVEYAELKLVSQMDIADENVLAQAIISLDKLKSALEDYNKYEPTEEQVEVEDGLEPEVEF